MISRQFERNRESSPLWLITMTDMYILLMSLFFLLFVLGRTQKPGPAHPGGERPGGGAMAGLPTPTLAAGEGTIATIGGDVTPFAEGSFELLPVHKQAISEVRKWMKGRMNRIVVRGHTAGNAEDAVILDDGRIRAVRRGDAGGDAWLLSMMRANAVRSELLGGAGDGVSEKRIEIRAEAFTRPLADSADARGRALNRRVEIVLGSDLVPE